MENIEQRREINDFDELESRDECSLVMEDRRTRRAACWKTFTHLLKGIWSTKDMFTGYYEKEKHIRASLREFVIYIVFLVLLSVVTLNMVSPDMYRYSQVLHQLFTSQESIKRIDQLWEFLENDFLDGIKRKEKISKGHCLIDPMDRMVLNSSRLIGVPQLRQLRIRNDSCLVNSRFRKWINVCYGHYSREIENVDSFESIIPRIYTNPDAWIYQSEKELNEYNFWGQLAVYSGAGSVQTLTKDRKSTSRIIQELKEGMWITRGTRFISLDFTLYNVNSNLFSIIRFSYEFPPTGGVVPLLTVDTVKLLRYLDSSDYVIMGSEMVLALFILYYFIEECLEIHSQRLKYFKGFWNILDLFVIIVTSLVLAFNVYTTYSVTFLLRSLLSVDDYFPEFISLARTYQYLQEVSAIAVFIAWIKVFKYISFNKTMLELSGTLRQSAPDVLGFLYSCFKSYLQLLLMWRISFLVPKFRDFDYAAMENADSVIGPIWFVSYIFFVFFILMNMFLAIISDKYSLVKSEIEEQNETFQVSDYLMRGYNNLRERISYRDKLIDIQTTIKAISEDRKVTYHDIRSAMRDLNFTDIEIDLICLPYQNEDGTYDFLKKNFDVPANDNEEVRVPSEKKTKWNESIHMTTVDEYLKVLKKVSKLEDILLDYLLKVENSLDRKFP
ncbi:PKD2 [Lepeophtheirus salmonis]|uniref:PKD2 n=1 Tax=Lepeophtheirus salmonis TaxID=72036 RepID=A0A7R8CJA6_LEPSM|nr:PKD2 [Lepeophtheirus salmonis]CAF2840463.1 PKD2 [Lepeophtheirus salmonis]